MSFAFLCLGIIESLTKGTIDASDAMRIFFHTGSCRFVRMVLRHESTDEIMGRSVQLNDLSDILPPEEARRELALIMPVAWISWKPNGWPPDPTSSQRCTEDPPVAPAKSISFLALPILIMPCRFGARLR
uniref:Uncharacterized protein n=1 Tax=Candidatus Kentrum sp. LFY TaxID=2126342 RepID=A0A450WYF3_9GAMM|nr:MAG: hypothetical protein BECKLFY1418C_GA0070996_111010 [Candidatus Kentron sp. LFY]